MDIFEPLPEDAKEIEGIEKLNLTSVGIDIGSSTSHLTFSELTARRYGTSYSSNYEISDKETLYQSEIRLTPYVEETTIDVDQLQEFFNAAYEEAGLTVEDIDTGAVIVTGEAAKKKNAERIADLFSEWAGKFVTASAGPTLEAIMAAHGSGAVDLATRAGSDLMNVDIGGGTSKITVVEDGEIVDVSCVNVGARLVATDKDGILKRVEPTAKTVAQLSGQDFPLEIGNKFDQGDKTQLANVFAGALFEFLTTDPANLSELAREITIKEPSFTISDVDMLTFSGGCSEYVYETEAPDFGDLGPALGAAVRARAESSANRIERPKRGIRATVLGSTQYSVQVSGNTIHLSDEGLLPVRNYQIVTVDACVNDSLEELYPRVQEALEQFDIESLQKDIALSFAVSGTVPTYETVQTIAKAIATARNEYDQKGPELAVLDMDLAQNVGSHVEQLLADDDDEGVIIVDNVNVGQLEYIDIGQPLQESRAVPVIVKSLVFGSRPE